jgi:hypothetical protein
MRSPREGRKLDGMMQQIFGVVSMPDGQSLSPHRACFLFALLPAQELGVFVHGFRN